MRVDALHLHAYGPFTDRTLDFRSGSFQLVYGHNEAGKSSMLRAIEAGLFGILPRTQDNFLHDNKNLRIGLELSNDDGKQLQFKRRKGTKGTLLSLDGEEAKLPENSLDAFLRGLERDRFRDMHCIDHDVFRSGGQVMLDLKGLAGDTLLAASDTIRFLELEKELANDLGELYGTRKGQLRDIKKNYEAARKDRKTSEVSAADWTKLKDQAQKLERRRDELREQIRAQDTQLIRFERLSTALPKIASLKIKEQELETKREELKKLLGDDAPSSLPQDYSAENRRDCEANIVSSKRSIAELEAQLREYNARLEKIQESPGLINLGDEIDNLQQRLETQRSGIEERQQLCSELELAEREVKRLMHELGLQIPLDEIPERQLRRDHKREIQQLVSDERSIAESIESLEKQRRQFQQELDTNRQMQDQLGDVIDVSTLELRLKEVERYDDIENQIAEQRATLVKRQEDAEVRVARIPYWDGSLDEVDRVPLPLAETIDRFDAEFAELEHEQKSIDESIQESRSELKKIQQEVAAEKKITSVVTEDELNRFRQRRDHGWSLVRQSWLEEEDASAVQEFASELPLDQAYEQCVGEADDVADRLRRESDRLTTLAVLEGQQADLSEKIELLEKKRLGIQQQHQQKLELWQSEWAPAGITEARPPKDMRGWLNKWSELRESARKIIEIRQDCERLEAVRDSAMAKLHAAFGTCGIESTADSLAMLLNQATQLVTKQQDLARNQNSLQDKQRDLASNLETVEADLKLARERKAAWRESWVAAMGQIDCDPDTTSARAQTLTEGLEDLTQKYEELLTRKNRIESIDESAKLFVHDVAKAAEQSMVSEFSDIEVADTEIALGVAKRLLLYFREAQRNAQQAATIREEQEKCEQRLTQHRDAMRSQELALDEFVKVAGVDSPELLAPLEEFSQLQRNCASMKDDIRISAGGIDFAEFVGQAEGYDDAALAADIRDLKNELKQQRESEHEIRLEQNDIQRKIDAIDGNSAVALADQQMMNLGSTAAEVANRCARLMIAQHILREQIGRYRESNQDPLLAKASDYFSAMACGEFTGLDTEYDDQGQRVIVGRRRSLGDDPPELVRVEQMSDGTRDPVFLALRLAYLQRRASQHEVMPLIVDDILIHLDDDRALATLQVLAEISAEMQVLFFTHHDRIRQLALSNLPSDILTVHELHRRGSQDQMLESA